MFGAKDKKPAIFLSLLTSIATACSSGSPPKERVADPIVLIYSAPPPLAPDATPVPPSWPRALRLQKTAAKKPGKAPILFIEAQEKDADALPETGSPRSESGNNKSESSGRSQDSLRTFNDK